MPLFNVRLDAEDARRVAALRKEGVVLSRLVREVIRGEYDRRLGKRGVRRTAAQILADIYLDFPELPRSAERSPERSHDVHDRREARAAIVRKLRKRP